ncbi:outer membrane protein assembly factor BamB family protein [Thiohalomonas denitrificans]|uniref:outer membrane protein assembly factor BamB family protein n=1 Tax=Thiohalomonas denitrificans TaxID=415747 RepID=UPI0015867BC9|nr:PQQ-binding-like beta-propeller repeat protein [Thiohalomonas denitrificans]
MDTTDSSINYNAPSGVVTIDNGIAYYLAPDDSHLYVYFVDLSGPTQNWREDVSGGFFYLVKTDPVVANGKLYYVVADSGYSSAEHRLRAFDLQSRTEVIDVVLPDGVQSDAMAVTDQGVYIVRDSFALVAFDAEDGTQLWDSGDLWYEDPESGNNLPTYPVTNGVPIVVGDTVYLAASESLKTFLYGFDPLNGDKKWTTAIFTDGASKGPIGYANGTVFITGDEVWALNDDTAAESCW